MKDFDVIEQINTLLPIMKFEDNDKRIYVRGLIDGMNTVIGFFNHDGLKRDLYQDESDSHPEQAS